ncbi:MAG: DUF2723 domain-containing protein [Elusimicrobiota bacterium]
MKRGCAAVFFTFFALYLWTMSPSLAAYRDTGEMTLSAHTLGVSHPPSYPLYILTGRLADSLPLAQPAYAIGLLSVVAGAGALAVLFLLLAGRYGPAAAGAGVLLLGTNATFWNVSTVQEMYSLTLLLAAVLLGLGLRLSESFGERRWYGAVFLFGLFLGNRTDLLLWLPGLLWLSMPSDFHRWRTRRRARLLLVSAGFGLLGLSVYLYLPLRSLQGPWLDWNHPAELYNFIGSLTRRGYGGTLDLLSKNYSLGAMFFPNLKVYGAHLWHNFSLLGLLLVAAGLLREFSVARRRCIGLAVLYGASGPLFLFLANLPPNPHAMAIVDPHYLLSDLILVCWAAAGAASLASLGLPRWAPAAAAAVLALQPWLLGRYGEMNRRWDLVSYDYVKNVMRAAPERSIIVAKKDVQLFSLWYYRYVRGRRIDLHVLPQGLSHSLWFQLAQKRFGSPLTLGELKTKNGWDALTRANSRPVYTTMDVEVPPGVALGPTAGLLTRIGLPAAGSSPAAATFQVRRGDYRYERRPDFFTADLVGDYAVAMQRRGSAHVARGEFAAARGQLMGAWSVRWRLPEAATFLAFLSFRSGDMEAALEKYQLADMLYDRTLALTREYHSLPDVVGHIRRAAADTSMNLGVVLEKKGDREAAERLYRKALAHDPEKAQAHYNIAVLYWQRDLRRSVTELEAALRIDPNHAEARKFLPVARSRLDRGQPPRLSP